MKTLTLYAIIGASALTIGAAGGVIYKRLIMDPEQNITGFNPEACKADAEALFEAVEKAGSKSAATKSMAPVDIANYASEIYKTYENSVSFCYGVADTVVQQDIRNAQIKNGDLYFEEAISKSSMVGIGKRMYQQGIEGELKLYEEKSANDVTISGDTVHTNFNQSPSNMTPDHYKELFGRTLPDMFIYCVHSLTITSEKLEEISGGYKVTLELNPLMGGYQYRYQMKTISSLDSYPVFEFITLTYTLDENLDLKHIQAHEKYKATMMGISPDIENTLEYDFFPNKVWNIPDVNQDVNYAELRGLLNA